MPHISKHVVRELIETLDVCGVGAHHPDLLALLDQQEGEPVAWLGHDSITTFGHMTYGFIDRRDRAIPDSWIPLYTHPPAPEIHGSDWFYKLKFICRVLEGSRPANGDVATALGMARSLFNEKHSEGMTAPRQPITADMVTDEMRYAFKDINMDSTFDDLDKYIVVAVNAYLGANI